jgi:hypothetical protein
MMEDNCSFHWARPRGATCDVTTLGLDQLSRLSRHEIVTRVGQGGGGGGERETDRDSSNEKWGKHELLSF